MSFSCPSRVLTYHTCPDQLLPSLFCGDGERERRPVEPPWAALSVCPALIYLPRSSGLPVAEPGMTCKRVNLSRRGVVRISHKGDRMVQLSCKYEAESCFGTECSEAFSSYPSFKSPGIPSNYQLMSFSYHPEFQRITPALPAAAISVL